MWIGRQEQAHVWDLRGAWAAGWDVALVLDAPACRRLRGRVTYVSTTGAFALVHDGEGPVHVPCGLILTIRRPHFSEPHDAPPPKSTVVLSEQLRLPILEGEEGWTS